MYAALVPPILSTVLIHPATTAPSVPSFSLTTSDRLENPGWWPTKGTPARTEYVGHAACVGCHGDVGASQETTPMYHAAVKASQSEILKQHTPMDFREDTYSYAMRREGADVTYSITDGAHSSSAPLLWALGAGEIGQTYLIKQNDRYYESRLSYYTSLGRLDITTGHSVEAPPDLAHAVGDRLSPEAAQRCLSCHMTAAFTSQKLDPEGATAGITCEACHGPGTRHAAAMNAQHYEEASRTIMNPASLSPSDSVDFCGSCHRTQADVAMMMSPSLGVASLRFQPYRLEKSRCWNGAGDKRITCVACHDPHQPLAHDLKAYDSKCLSCHLKAKMLPHGNVTAAACKVATENCASCHMPKYEVPQTHAKFTDHDIRIVPAHERFPL